LDRGFSPSGGRAPQVAARQGSSHAIRMSMNVTITFDTRKPTTGVTSDGEAALGFTAYLRF
jgi:hypothetical protein